MVLQLTLNLRFVFVRKLPLLPPEMGAHLLKRYGMEAAKALYLGRNIEKRNFRTYVYGANGEKRLVESWEEFEASIQSGVWFISLDDSKAPDIDELPKVVKGKSKQKSKSKPIDDESVFEVTDDFLPKGNA